MDAIFEKITENLNQFIGQACSYDCHSMCGSTRRLLMDLFQNTTFSPDKFECRPYGHSHWSFGISYKGYEIASVDCKRKVIKETYRGREFAYKEFVVTPYFPDVDFMQKLAECENAALAEQKRKADEREMILEFYREVKQKYGFKENYQVRYFLEKAVKEYWSIDKEI